MGHSKPEGYVGRSKHSFYKLLVLYREMSGTYTMMWPPFCCSLPATSYRARDGRDSPSVAGDITLEYIELPPS